MQKETSCINSRAILDYLKTNEIDYTDMLKGLDPEIDGTEDPERFLRNPGNWISCGVVSLMFERATRLLDDERAAFKMGQYVTENTQLGFVKLLVVKTLWSYKKALHHIQQLNDQWNKSKKIELKAVGTKGATIRLHWAPEMKTSKYICQYNQGVYTYIPLIWGGSPLALEEKCCYFDGAPYCEYQMKWPLRNRLSEIVSRFFTTQSVLKTTFEKIENNNQIIRKQNKKLESINRELLEKIDENRRVVDKLNENSNLLSLILDSTKDGILVGHNDGRFSYANKSFAEMWQIPKRILEKNLRKELHEVVLNQLKDPEGFMTKLNQLYRSGQAASDEIEFKDGRIFERYSEPMIKKKKVVGRVWSFRNATEQKQAEKALRKSEERFRQLAELLPETIFEMDTEGNLTFVNRSAYQHFRYTVHEFDAGLNTLDMLDPADRQRATKNIQKVLGGEDIGLQEYTALRKDGSTFPAIIHSTAIYQENRLVGLRGFIIDISEKKRLEAQLQQAQKMESIGTLAGGIAHDFNNILAPIMIHSEMIMADLSPDNPLQHNVSEIYRSAERAKNLVKHILTFSRQKEEKRIPVQLGVVLKESLKMLRSTIPTTIDIRQKFDTTSDMVLADPTRLHQIIMNLCTNAQHAMRENGGVFEIGLADEVINSETAGTYTDLLPSAYVKLTVRDTGHGMSADILKRVFDPYFTTKKPGEGTGMGLSIVHGIIKSFGGDIAVESDPGKGTTFTVLLPRIEGMVSANTVHDAKVHRGTERILLIDDEKIIVDAVQPALERMGYKVTAKTSSIEALNLFRMKPNAFDLIITDMTMPNMTGTELMRNIKKIHPRMPVILCTGFSDQVNESTAKDIGLSAFVMKPVVIKDLAETVRSVMNRKSAISA